MLLNKKDMLREGELASLVEIVHSLNPLAQVKDRPGVGSAVSLS